MVISVVWSSRCILTSFGVSVEWPVNNSCACTRSKSVYPLEINRCLGQFHGNGITVQRNFGSNLTHCG